MKTKINLLIILLTLCYYVFPQDRITGRIFATRSEVIATHGMACTSQPLATQAALDILKAGGNAVDAAIAAEHKVPVVMVSGDDKVAACNAGCIGYS